MKEKVPFGMKVVLSALLAVFLYIAIPTLDDAFIIPALAYFLKLPLLIIAVAYYGIAWAIVLAIEAFL